MLIPTFDEYKWLEPQKRQMIRHLQRSLGLPVYESKVGIPSSTRGQIRPQMRGPKPPRPHLWMYGPDPIRHQQHDAYNKHRAQALFRGEEYSLTFYDYEQIWGDLWHRRGKQRDSMVMTRQDLEDGWHPYNTIIMLRLDHLRRMGEFKRALK